MEEKTKDCHGYTEEGVDARVRDLISEQGITQEQQFGQIR